MTKKIIQITDTHLYSTMDEALEWTDAKAVYPNQNLLAVLDRLIIQQDVEALIISGDLAQEMVLETYQLLDHMLDICPFPVYVIPGNHDIPELMKQGMSAPRVTTDVLDVGNWRLVLLDSSCPEHVEGVFTEHELSRLKNHIETVGEKSVVLFLHHHLQAIGWSKMDGYMLQDADKFLSILEQYPQVKAIYHGHIHQTYLGQHAHISIVGTPATSVQLEDDNGDFGYCYQPAWREILLHDDGTIESEVIYL
jgi:Icc protein